MTVDWAPVSLARARVHVPERLSLDWQLAVTLANSAATPLALPGSATWMKAVVPGTAMQVVQGEGAAAATAQDLHEHDVWYRAAMSAQEGGSLRFLGLAGLAEIWIDGRQVANSISMFVSTTVELPLGGEIEIAICFRALGPSLRRPSGRARWRTRLVTSNSLRLYRQTLLGHMPGWCPSIPAIGPFRPVELIEAGAILSCRLSTRLHGSDGHLSVALNLAGPVGPHHLRVEIEDVSAPLRFDTDGGGTCRADLVLPHPDLWWPHTHGTPRLYDVILTDGEQKFLLGRTGFRDVTIERDPDERGFALSINGVPIFCRGACWTSADLARLAADRADYLPWLTLVRDAGLNMIRVGGTMLYEGAEFHELCDEMGILVWQDLMFANMDYPMEREELRSIVLAEVNELVERLDGSPSFVILCGGSEMAQQAAMLGLDEGRRAMPFFERDLPLFLATIKQDLLYVPHSPWGGEIPFSVGAGVAHYYGVGAYRRPLEDARRANVRFATECLAFANPPSCSSPAMEAVREVPRDLGVSWDFADIRDHYLQVLYGADPKRLRIENPARYLTLSRAVTADLMEATFAEWRRPGSSCAGGLVWQLQDVAPGSGWGIIDSYCLPKAAWHGMRRICAPLQLMISDEGLDGLALHVVNETTRDIDASLELICLRRGVTKVARSERSVVITARGSISLSSREMFENFFDINRAFMFGPVEHDVTVATLRCASSGLPLSEAFHFPTGRSLPPDELDLSASFEHDDLGWSVLVACSRFAQAIHFEFANHYAAEEWFHLPAGRTRRVRLIAGSGSEIPPQGLIHALNSWQPLSVRATA